MKRILAITLTLAMLFAILAGCNVSQSNDSTAETDIGTSDEDYGKIQFFPQPILEFTEEDTYDTTKFLYARLTDSDMDLLRQVYNGGKGWIDDSVVDRLSFYFDGRIRFTATDSFGWMYFGLEQSILYYDGMFTAIDDNVRKIIERVRQNDINDEITFSASDVLSQKVLSDPDKQTVMNILSVKTDSVWASDIPECDWICRFSGAVEAGYCDCGTVSDFTNCRSRKLTAEEKEKIQGLITRYTNNNDGEFHEHVPYDAMLNLEVWNGKFLFQRIATTPCIVYSSTPINDMSQGTVFDDRHDILTTVFQAMHGKEAVVDTIECVFSHYIYMFDNEREDIPWHYRFAICTCGAVMITNNDELICTIVLTAEEIQSVLKAFGATDTDNTYEQQILSTLSRYLDDVGFVPGLSQGEFISQVEQYKYNGTAVTDIIAGLHYDGPRGGGWQLSDGMFGFYNDYTVSEDEKYSDYSNRLYAKTGLEGLPLPYDISFGDTLDAVLEKMGVELDPDTDFIPDENSDTDMTLYSIGGKSLVLQNMKHTNEPADHEAPYTLIYTETEDTSENVTTQRKISLRFDGHTAAAPLLVLEISVNERTER